MAAIADPTTGLAKARDDHILDFSGSGVVIDRCECCFFCNHDYGCFARLWDKAYGGVGESI